ncbi:MAG: hypothetical protein MZV70_54055 [Desulfobacterales bacterium]|nr:hypothetical protein [Desulfobacterales bacterium]
MEEELKKAEALVAARHAGAPASTPPSCEKGATAPVMLNATAPGPPPSAAAGRPRPRRPVYRRCRCAPTTRRAARPTPRSRWCSSPTSSAPSARRVEPTLKQLEEAFPGQVRVVWKHQPLPFHPNALPAALAAEAAREQGKFWQMHDKLFAEPAGSSRRPSLRGLGPRARARPRQVPGRGGRPRRGEARVAEDQALAQQVGAQRHAHHVLQLPPGGGRHALRAASAPSPRRS